jgi:uncharacterized membrane protein YecN with MAPEG domain
MYLRFLKSLHMGPLDLAIHLLSFLAPALAVAALVALAARIFMPRRAGLFAWWVQFALNSIAGVAVLAAGLWHYGVDGKMATYAALVVGVAACQWVCSRSWQG